MASTKVAGAGVGGIGGIVDNAKIKGSGVEVDDSVFGGGIGIGGFGDSRKKRA